MKENVQLTAGKFAEELQRVQQNSPTNGAKLSAFGDLPVRGQKITLIYEAEIARNPTDMQLRASMALHLYNMGYMYGASLLSNDKPLGTATGIWKGESKQHANLACQYMVRSFGAIPGASAALALADLFKRAGFYSTSWCWLELADSGSHDGAQFKTQIDAKRLELRQAGEVRDPRLPAHDIFPDEQTPGLIVESQGNTMLYNPPTRFAYEEGSSYNRYTKTRVTIFVVFGVMLVALGVGMGVVFKESYINMASLLGVAMLLGAWLRSRRFL